MEQIDNIEIKNTELLSKVSKEFVKENLILPVEDSKDFILVLTDSEDKIFKAQNLAEIFNKPVEIKLADSEKLNAAIDHFYFTQVDVTELNTSIKDNNDEFKITTEIKSSDDLLYKDASSEPVIHFVNSVIISAIKENSTDIHFESYENNLKVRFRIDGKLYEKTSVSKNQQAPVITRIKIMSNLNIAENRLPQDGRFQISFGGRKIDFRVSSIPTNYGERIVLRILDKTKHLLQLDKLGMNNKILEIFRKKIYSPNGIILVTGPTGSGKTTSLYASLMEILSEDKNIMTIEDPIEYQINGISQTQVKQSIGLTFAKGLRSLLRQDPDIMMIGEIRDLETLNIAVQSSLTGHLVFSTLHTNGSVSSITRLYNMGVKPYLISSSVIAIMAQRLVRKLCDNCKEQIELSKEYIHDLGLSSEDLKNNIFYTNKGCSYCSNTGYTGRIGVYELLEITDEIKEFINEKKSLNEIKNYLTNNNFTFFFDDALKKFKQGITSFEEVIALKHK